MIEVNVTQKLLQELTVATQRVLQLYKLGGSDMQKEIEFVYKNDQFFLVSYDYFTYVSTGRRPRARKVPVEDIIKWMKEKNIAPHKGSTYSQTAFAIVNSIYKSGIKARSYVSPVVDVTTDIISIGIAEDLSEQIATELAKELSFTIGNG